MASSRISCPRWTMPPTLQLAVAYPNAGTNAPNSSRPSIFLTMLLMPSISIRCHHHLHGLFSHPSQGACCPFLTSNLASWLLLRSPTLCILELRMDMASEKSPDFLVWLHCTGKELEGSQALGCLLNKSPDWGTFNRLHNREIVEADMTDDALKNTLQAFPNLTDSALLRCHGVASIDIKMEKLESCRLEFSGMANHSLSFSAPRIQVLDIKGFSWIHVEGNQRLTHICTAENSGD